MMCIYVRVCVCKYLNISPLFQHNKQTETWYLLSIRPTAPGLPPFVSRGQRDQAPRYRTADLDVNINRWTIYFNLEHLRPRRVFTLLPECSTGSFAYCLFLSFDSCVHTLSQDFRLGFEILIVIWYFRLQNTALYEFVFFVNENEIGLTD